MLVPLFLACLCRQLLDEDDVTGPETSPAAFRPSAKAARPSAAGAEDDVDSFQPPADSVARRPSQQQLARAESAERDVPPPRFVERLEHT